MQTLRAVRVSSAAEGGGGCGRSESGADNYQEDEEEEAKAGAQGSRIEVANVAARQTSRARAIGSAEERRTGRRMDVVGWVLGIYCVGQQAGRGGYVADCSAARGCGLRSSW